MHKRVVRSLVTVSWLLVYSLSLANAAAPEPVWRLDLRHFGYQEQAPADLTSQRLIRIWFNGASLTVEVLTQQYDGAQKEWSHPNLSDTWTFDMTSQKLISKQVYLHFEPAPKYGPTTWAPGVVGRWKDATITRDDHGALFLQHTGQQPTVIFPGNKERLRYAYDCPIGARFLGVDRIAVLDCSRKAIVTDDRGQKKYMIATDLVEGNARLNRDGTDFTVYQYSLSPKKWPLVPFAVLSDEVTIAADRANVKVFSSKDGRQLFEYTWNLDKNERYNGGPVALSEDGSRLALIKNSELLIFPVAIAGK